MVVSGFTGVIAGPVSIESGLSIYMILATSGISGAMGSVALTYFWERITGVKAPSTADQIIEGSSARRVVSVDHPSDKGGPTRWGITQTTARAHGYTGDMRNPPRETAKQILLSDYWTGPRFDRVAALSTLLADELCDTGVNMGPSVASKFFQRWLTAMNMRGKLYPDLIPDGAIGPRTITAL